MTCASPRARNTEPGTVFAERLQSTSIPCIPLLQLGHHGSVVRVVDTVVPGRSSTGAFRSPQPTSLTPSKVSFVDDRLSCCLELAMTRRKNTGEPSGSAHDMTLQSGVGRKGKPLQRSSSRSTQAYDLVLSSNACWRRHATCHTSRWEGLVTLIAQNARTLSMTEAHQTLVITRQRISAVGARGSRCFHNFNIRPSPFSLNCCKNAQDTSTPTLFRRHPDVRFTLSILGVTFMLKRCDKSQPETYLSARKLPLSIGTVADRPGRKSGGHDRHHFVTASPTPELLHRAPRIPLMRGRFV